MSLSSSKLIRAFSSWRMATVLLLGFSSGVPLALTGSTLQAWMTVEKVDLTVIGIFALVGLPYTLKFLWAPAMDRYVPPFLGRRRGWILITQLLLMAMLSLMALCDPSGAPGLLALVAFLVAFCSASQDIVVDAYRTEILNESERGIGVGIYIMGYRIAMIVSGALALVLSDHVSWRAVYLIMASIFGVAMVVTWFAPEPEHRAPPPKTMAEAITLPLVDFFKRKGAIESLVFILLYKLGDVAVGSMTMPFMISMGFSRTEIGAVNKGMGLAATIVGSLSGGALMVRLGQYRALWLFGILAACSNLTFMLLAHTGKSYPVMISAIGIENFATGMGTAAFSAFLMSLCNMRFTASQYALLTSLMAVSRVFIGSQTGWMAKSLGWEMYFLTCSSLAIPGLMMLFRYSKWMHIDTDDTPQGSLSYSQ